MAAKKKPAHAPDTDTWTVIIDGNTPVEVTAQSLEISDNGILVFGTDEVIVKAVAGGHWSEVDLKPPVDETPEP
jgi:hypothetical protein